MGYMKCSVTTTFPLDEGERLEQVASGLGMSRAAFVRRCVGVFAQVGVDDIMDINIAANAAACAEALRTLAAEMRARRMNGGGDNA